MITSKTREHLERQQYRIAGKHSSVKICSWTKKSLLDEGICYKEKFYGIKSHRCCQMTPSMICSNNCVYCWRTITSFIGSELKGEIDGPEEIIDNCIKGHLKLLNGFPGNPKVNKEKIKEAKEVLHFAISLVGEPLVYPRINELVKELDKRRISSFLVTNGQFPEAIKNLKRVTQLYLSLDAPTKEIYEMIDRPMFKDYWERLNKSLEYFSEKKFRRCIRLTLVKGVNMCCSKEYAELIKKSNTDFIEFKAYMHLGASRKNLKRENMPYHKDVRDFAEETVGYLDDYEILDEQKASRVVMAAKKKFNGNTKIDFDGYFKLSE